MDGLWDVVDHIRYGMAYEITRGMIYGMSLIPWDDPWDGPWIVPWAVPHSTVHTTRHPIGSITYQVWDTP